MNKIWLDGQWIDQRVDFGFDANANAVEAGLTKLLSPEIFGLHYAYAVIDGVRAYRGTDGVVRLFRPIDHMRRLKAGSAAIGITCDESVDTLVEVHRGIVERNSLQDCYLRALIFVGEGGWTFNFDRNKIHTCVMAMPFPTSYYQHSRENGIRLTVSSVPRPNADTPWVGVKASAYYLNSLLAKREAKRAMYDDALLLTSAGSSRANEWIAEGSSHNVFFRFDDHWATPPLSSCLNGITRDTVIWMLKKRGHKVVERPISIHELGTAREGLLSATAIELRAIREIRVSDDVVHRFNPKESVEAMQLMHWYESEMRAPKEYPADWFLKV